MTDYSSNSKQRVEIDRKVFGHPVVGSLTGRTMSTPDTDKPELVEVAVMRTDDEEGLVWVPADDTARLTYEVSVMCMYESHASPTDAVLSMIDWLRSGQVGGITFTVESPDDKITYTVEAEQGDDDEWVAAVTHAQGRGKNNQIVERNDLVPGYVEPVTDPAVEQMADAVAKRIGDSEITPHRVATELRGIGMPVGDAQVLQVSDVLRHRRRQG